MGRIFGGREVLVRLSNHRFRFIRRKPFSSNANKPSITNSNNAAAADGDGSLSKYDAYRDLDKLDFMTAAKILFTNPPKQKKFGIDFHLVQLFFVCMPSLGIPTHKILFLVTAVYLVAQYARYEMRRMEAELEVKKQAEEEAKAKEMELKEAEEKEARSDPEILEVKERLGKLEEVVKEFVVESKKQSGNCAIAKNQKGDNEKKQLTIEPSKSASEDNHSKQTSNGRRAASSGQQDTSVLAVVTDTSQKNHVGGSRDEKK
ncbi:hypothetical protein LguiB_017732 [Lonicera macranthoides]